MIFPSTFSIVACDLDERSWGVAVASKFLAVGAVVPWAVSTAGAVATQAHANTSFGPRGLGLLAEGYSVQAALDRLLSEDKDREKRQVGIVDAQGGSASFTGSNCYRWAGGITGPGFAAQGNILAGEQVVQSMVSAFTEIRSGDTLADRLYRALLAGDRSGGDRRGRQSAAILVVKPKGGYGELNDRWIDYRVDDDPDPVGRLGELLDLHRLYFGESPESEKVHLTGNLLIELQSLLKRLGYYQGSLNGSYDLPTRAAFEAMIGNENFEDRINPEEGTIDRPVLEYLFNHFGEE